MIEIFGSPACRKCLEAKAFFDAKGVAYTEHNVKENPMKRIEMVNATEQLGLPQIRIGENWYVGWDEKRMEKVIASLA